MILNKVDLVSPEGSGGVLDELEKEIHNINALANVIRTVRCQVDLAKILDCRAYDATVSCFLSVCQLKFHFLFILNSFNLLAQRKSHLTNVAKSTDQHITRLEGLLDGNHTLSTQNLHDSGVRTLCISELQQVDLDKVVFSDY